MVGGGLDQDINCISSIDEPSYILSIGLSALVALSVSVYCLSAGIYIIFPHLFYVPIILAAYHYPSRGVGIAAMLASAYFVAVFFLSTGGTTEIANALVRAGVFLIVAAVVSHLSGSLQVREARYRGIFETSGAGIFLFSPQSGKIENMNQHCAEMLGYTDDDLPLDVSAVWSGYREHIGALERSRGGGLDCVLTTRDGLACPVFLSASLLPERQEGCVVITEMGEQKRMENQLRRSKETLRVILDTTDVGILLIDPGRSIVEANLTAVRLFGAAGREDLIAKDPYDLVSREYLEIILAYQREVLRGGVPASFECMLCRFDGFEWPGEVSFTLIPKDEAGPERLVISLRDITKRRQMAKKMQEENRRLGITGAVLAAASASQNLDDFLSTTLTEIVTLLDLDFGAVYLTRPGDDLAKLRVSIGEVAGIPSSLQWDGTTHRCVLTDGSALSVDQYCEKYLGHCEGGMKSCFVVPILADDTSVGCITVASRDREMIVDEDRQILLGIGEKLGNGVMKGILHEDLEAALVSANYYLEEANSAAAEVNLYVDILTHDINNANTVAMGYLYMVLNSVDEPVRGDINRSLAAINQSVDIIRNVTTIRRMEKEDADLHPIKLGQILQQMRNYYMDINIALNGSDAVVLADDLITEVFANLINNAVKFGGEGVEVTIDVQEEKDRVSVVIADTGPGIPDDLKPYLFERNQRGATKESGKGLGLYIVKTLVDRYGGYVRVTDRIPGRPEEGVAITVTLKRSSPVGR